MRAPTQLTRWIVGVCLLLPLPAFAQQNAVLNGKVFDPDGLALPGATVTVHQESTGFTRTVVSAGNGAYEIINLPPGVYDVQVEVPGFATVRRSGLELTAGAQITLDWRTQLAGVEEAVTVTAEAPLVEKTSNKIGATLSTREIEEVPSNFRNFTALTQLVPGMTPNPAQSSFEGGQVNANGSPAQSNLYLLDGAYNNDDRLGGSQGTQVRVVLDNIQEYQVLGNQYSAEYGGAAGAIINMVTRSGSNRFSGRVYNYWRDDKLNARSPILAPGSEKPDEQTLQTGFGIGGPIKKDRAHFYFTFERDSERIAGQKLFPPEAAPLAVDQVGAFEVNVRNYYGRGDIQITQNNFLTVRWVLETAPSLGEEFNTNNQVPDAKAYESDWDQVLAGSFTSVLSDRSSNVLRFGRIGEQLGTGAKTFFNAEPSHKDFHIGYDGRSQFEIGSSNEHPSYIAGPGGEGMNTRIRTYSVDDTFSYFLPTGRGEHTFKAGFGFSANEAVPRALESSGLFIFESDLPYDPANPETYPSQFEIVVGPEGVNSFDTNSRDHRLYLFAADQWRTNDRLTVNLGVRYDHQDQVPEGTSFSPRLGLAYDLTGDGTTVLRGGVGWFAAYTPISVDIFTQQQAIITTFPQVTITDPNSPVLHPDMTTDSAGNPGVAVLSPAGVAALEALRDSVLAGLTFNRNPRVDNSSRKMPLQIAWSAGVSRQLGPEMALTIDYVANVAHNQLGIIDINEPVNGVRPGVDGFDPNGEIVPPEARGVNFARVLQYQSNPDLDGDYKSLQVSFVKRFSHRWSMRHAYTWQRSNYVGLGNPDARRVWLDNDIRADYGRFQFDRTHVLAMSGTWNPWDNLTIAGVLSATSGAPYNETTGIDGNRDGDRTDRPIKGVDDLAKPIVSKVDGQGRAVINGLQGPGAFELSLSFRYAIPLKGQRGLDLSWDIYNLTNRVNYNTPSGNRSSSLFMVSTSARFPRQMQLGIRFRF